MSKPRIFIDGEAGTTGLQIRARLQGRTDLELLSIDPALRKDEGERRRLLNAADVAILCLPDEAAREAASWIDSPNTRVLDPSSAHRVTEGWTYGLPELTPGQADAIRASKRVSVPGCYSTGMIALVRPLVDAGLLSPDHPVTVNGASGYSGGGRQLIDAVQGRGEHRLAGPYRAYALELSHKHMPEMRQYGGLSRAPLFTPNVGGWLQGMLVSVPLPLWALPGKVTAAHLRAALEAHYAGSRFVRVVPQGESPDVLDPEALNGTNRMELFVYDNAQHEHALLVARLDNLGKGASGQAAQCLDLMLGLEGPHDYAVSEEAVSA